MFAKQNITKKVNETKAFKKYLDLNTLRRDF